MRAVVAVLTAMLLLCMGVVVPAAAADVVGKITQVEGRVEFLKGGKLPAVEAKLEDGVQVGDVLRTKSLSKAQITFMDNTVLTVSPESRIAIEEYMFDPGKGKRSAVVQLFQGLAHVVVSKLFKVTEPDFVVKTHTAVMGVRGTEFGIRLHPNSSTILNFEGHTEVGNIFPEVGDLQFKKANKIAFAWGGTNTVHLHNMQGSTVFRGLPPTQPFVITPLDRQQFMGQMGSGLITRRPTKSSDPKGTAGGGSGSGSGSSSSSGGSSGDAASGGSPAGGSSASFGGPTGYTPNASIGGPESVSSPIGSATSSSGNTAGETASSGLTAGGGGTASGASTYNYTPVSLGGPDSGLSSSVSSPGTTPGITAIDTAITTATTTTNGMTRTSEPTPAVPSSATAGGSGATGIVQDQVVLPPSVTAPPTPTTTPPPTPSTYTFTSNGYSAWQTTAAPDGRSNTITTSGWGQTSGSWPTGTFPSYYTTSSTGSRTVLQGGLLSSTTGTSTGTLSGTVSGVLGSTLTGTGTYAGLNSYGEVSNYTGTIVIDSSGKMTFTYNNGTISSTPRLVSASGTITYTPGTYFTQTTDGAFLTTSTAPYKSSSSTTTGTGLWAGGSRTGVLPGNFALAMTGTENYYYGYAFRNQLSDVTATMQGVVSPLSTGGYQGAMTILPNNLDTGFVSSMLPQFQPNPYQFLGGYRSWINTPMVSSITIQPSGSASGTMYANDYWDGKFSTSVFSLTQTPQPAAPTPVSATYNFTESFNGAFYLGSPGSNNSTNTSGWGLRDFSGTGSTPATSVYNGYFNSFSSGTWTQSGGSGSLPAYYNSSLVSGSAATGTVSGILGKSLSGSMTFTGTLLNGASFSYSGPVTMDRDGYLTFNYKNGGGYASNWVFPGGASGTASGTMAQSPGYHFVQTLAGDYQITNSNPYNATLSVSSTSAASGSRAGVYGGTVGPFGGSFALNYPNQGAPASTSGTAAYLTLEGVVNNSNLGGTFGTATLDLQTADSLNLNLSIPGMISLSAGTPGFAGGSFFSPGGVFIQTNSAYPVQVMNYPTGQSYLTQTPVWNFSETYQGFRMSTTSASPYLANVEGYGWTKFTSSNLPSSSYLGTGYGLAQNLGTIASGTPVTSNILGTSGTINGTLSGVAGQTLTGQATYTGTNSSGIAFTYQGQVSLSPTGQLFFNYGGNWSSPSGQTGTGGGMIQQVPGTYFSESVTGNYKMVATAGTGGTPNTMAIIDQGGLTGSLKVGSAAPTTTTASVAVLQSSTVNSFGSSTGAATGNVQGVVAGSDWQNKWGVATISGTATPTGGTAITTPSVTGPVTIDTTGKLTMQAVGTVANSFGTTPQPPDTISANLISVPSGSGLTTSSYAQTATGGISQTATSNASGLTTTTPTALTGANIGALAGNTAANMTITGTALQPNSYPAGATTGTLTVNSAGVVAGPAGGTQTGVSTVHAVKTVGTTTVTPVYVGSTTLTPAIGSAPTALTTVLSGINSIPAPPIANGVGATQTGTITVTPR